MSMMMGIGTPSSQSSIARPMSVSFFNSGLIVAPTKRANIHFVPAKRAEHAVDAVAGIAKNPPDAPSMKAGHEEIANGLAHVATPARVNATTRRPTSSAVRWRSLEFRGSPTQAARLACLPSSTLCARRQDEHVISPRPRPRF